jgi:hypothetical protein
VGFGDVFLLLLVLQHDEDRRSEERNNWKEIESKEEDRR